MTIDLELDAMSRADAAAWRSAQTVADLGRLMARWLEGDLVSHPGYIPGCGPDEETDELVPVLARLNRAGFLTDCSQPGERRWTDAGWWEQRAAVSGFIADPALADRLTAACLAADLIVATEPIPASLDEVEQHTWFGGQRPEADLDWLWRPHVSPAAWGDLRQARQVTFIEPHLGRNDRLWTVLDVAIAERR
ncbi:DUF6919 domain-containing protein [Streptomyces sp. NPDC054784]